MDNTHWAVFLWEPLSIRWYCLGENTSSSRSRRDSFEKNRIRYCWHAASELWVRLCCCMQFVSIRWSNLKAGRHHCQSRWRGKTNRKQNQTESIGIGRQTRSIVTTCSVDQNVLCKSLWATDRSYCTEKLFYCNVKPKIHLYWIHNLRIWCNICKKVNQVIWPSTV